MTLRSSSPAGDSTPDAAHERLRVFITADTVGGVWDYAVELSRGLAEAGHAVRLAVIGTPSADRLARVPETVDLVTADYRLEWMPDSEADVDAAGEWLARSAREWGADVVHLSQMTCSIHDFAAPTLVVVHSDVSSWFSETRGMLPPPEWDRYVSRVAGGLEAADVVATPSAYQAELTLRHYARVADHVIHNGIRPPPAAHAARAALATHAAPVVISVGRAWDAAKGMAVLDAAAGLLEGSAIDLHLLGETRGPHGQAFVARHARAHGRLARAEVDAWLGRAAIYVGASLYEPFGLAPLEAAFHGTALLLSDIGSFRELWDGCAVFFPAGDPGALAAAVAELVADPGHAADLGDAARTRALERYSADTFVARYLDLYAAMRLQLAPKPSCV